MSDRRSRQPYTIKLKPLRDRLERATVDFESRSACDLKRRGAWLYSKDDSTEILCLAWKIPGMREPKLWHRAHPDIGIEESEPPWALFRWIDSGGLVEAHNAFFEMCIWANIAVPVHGWPVIAEEQWRCSAAKAAAHALPRDLKGATDALELPVRKDERGKALLNKYSKPKRLTKNEKDLWGDDEIIFNEDVEGLRDLWEYCRQDVRAEERLSETIADLSPTELKVWQITNRMNFRGVLIDIDLARSALALASKAKAKANAEFFKLTGIKSATQRAVVKAWLAANEALELPDTKAKTLEFYLDRNPVKLSKRARRVLEIVKNVNRTSTNKFKRMLECVDDDGRARELLAYHSAHTGRWAGRGIQVQNLPKGNFAKYLPKATAMDIACEDVKSQDLAWCESIHGDVMNMIASCLRGAIIAPPGKDLLIADYAAIEARVVLWAAGATKALEVFKGGGDIYCDMASGIYGYQIVKDERALALNPGAKIAAVINAMGSTQRDFGKVAILGLGFGMGFLKFLITLRTYKIYLTRAEVLQMMGPKRFKKYIAVVRRKLFPTLEDLKGDEKRLKAAEREARIGRRMLADEQEDPAKVLHELALCKYTVDTYRRRYPEVPQQMWKAQETAAIKAVRTGKAVRCGVVVWKVVGRFLKCRLPSGRCLHYANPEIKFAKTSWGESRPSLRFMGRNQKTGRWQRQATYGGRVTENIVQAIARDIMAFAKCTLEEAYALAYLLLLSVHDELITEVDSDTGSPEELEFVMSDLPPCYDGCPITAEGRRLRRYRKI